MRPRRVLLPLALASLLSLALAGCVDDNPDPPVEGPATEPVDAVVPSIEKDVLDGAVMCGVGTPVGTANPCTFVDGRNNFDVTVGPGLKTLLIGLDYAPNAAALHNVRLIIDSADFDPVQMTGYNYHGGDGGPGYIVRIDNDDIESTEHKWDNLTAPTALLLRIFASSEGAVLIQQEIDIHIMTFYHEEAAEDATPFEEPVADGG